MKIVSDVRKREFITKLGVLEVADTIRQCVDDHGNVMLQTTVRTEFHAEWLNEVMAQELWNWMHYGFQGPPPDWAA